MTIRKSVLVRCPPDRAFHLFTRQIGSWWPLQHGFSLGRERAKEIFLDDAVGGRFYERLNDGTELEIGRVIDCDPPRRIVVTWRLPDWERDSEVEVRFTADGDGTRVELEHRGLEPTPEREGAFNGGWATVLGHYVEAANRVQRSQQMKLYHFPSPNPQKVTFALRELDIECELVPVDLAKGEHRQPGYLQVNPTGRVPALVDDGLVLSESHAILSYLGEKTGRLWPTTPAGKAEALQWLFYQAQHIMPSAAEVALPIRSKVSGQPYDEELVARGQKALAAALGVVENRLAKSKWLLSDQLSLVDCAYCPILNVADKAGFSFAELPGTARYLDTLRSRPAWQATPKLPMLA